MESKYQDVSEKYEEANKKYLKSAENLFRLGAPYEMVHKAMPDIPVETLREMENRAKKEKNPA